MSTIYGVAASSPAIPQSSAALPGNTLGQDEFLKLLAMQLQYQDPLNPMDNQQFLSQLAQFSSLQEMTSVSQVEQKVLAGIRQLQWESGIGSAYQLLGALVQGTDSNGNPVNGTVTGIKTVNGEVMLEVGQSLIGLGALQSVSK
jgi:flagellar basal-body rod modification protein FlgD